MDWPFLISVAGRPYNSNTLAEPLDQTNGMVERLSGRISEALATHHFNSWPSLERTLKRYVHLYNHHLPQKALGHKAPIMAMRNWYAEQPRLFYLQPRNHPGPDIGWSLEFSYVSLVET